MDALVETEQKPGALESMVSSALGGSLGNSDYGVFLGDRDIRNFLCDPENYPSHQELAVLEEQEKIRDSEAVLGQAVNSYISFITRPISHLGEKYISEEKLSPDTNYEGIKKAILHSMEKSNFGEGKLISPVSAVLMQKEFAKYLMRN